MVDFVIKPFKPAEQKVLKKVVKQAREAITTVVEEGLAKAMNENN